LVFLTLAECFSSGATRFSVTLATGYSADFTILGSRARHRHGQRRQTTASTRMILPGIDAAYLELRFDAGNFDANARPNCRTRT
jgi:hypothetical protein